MQPTVLTGTTSGMKVCAEEVFGPIVVIEPVSTYSEAIGLINAGRFGLQAGVFTDSIVEMNLAFNKLKVGGVIINDVPTFRVDHMPYGGIKDSGLGREGVKYAILDMMEPRLLVKYCWFFIILPRQSRDFCSGWCEKLVNWTEWLTKMLCI